jgi:hypothetical protein
VPHSRSCVSVPIINKAFKRYCNSRQFFISFMNEKTIELELHIRPFRFKIWIILRKRQFTLLFWIENRGEEKAFELLEQFCAILSFTNSERGQVHVGH